MVLVVRVGGGGSGGVFVVVTVIARGGDGSGGGGGDIFRLPFAQESNVYVSRIFFSCMYFFFLLTFSYQLFFLLLLLFVVPSPYVSCSKSLVYILPFSLFLLSHVFLV